METQTTKAQEEMIRALLKLWRALSDDADEIPATKINDLEVLADLENDLDVSSRQHLSSEDLTSSLPPRLNQ